MNNAQDLSEKLVKVANVILKVKMHAEEKPWKSFEKNKLCREPSKKWEKN